MKKINIVNQILKSSPALPYVCRIFQIISLRLKSGNFNKLASETSMDLYIKCLRKRYRNCIPETLLEIFRSEVSPQLSRDRLLE